jgi:hypothetical protein
MSGHSLEPPNEVFTSNVPMPTENREAGPTNLANYMESLEDSLLPANGFWDPQELQYEIVMSLGLLQDLL